jgi:hypothetical protein
MDAQENCTAAFRKDTVGKVFIVTQGMRRCLICNQVFTRQASARHANVVCWPEKRP